MRRSTRLLRLSAAAASFVPCLCAYLLLLFFLAQAPFFRPLLIAAVNDLLAPEGLSLSAEDMHGILPFDFSLGRLSLTDAEGDLLRVRDLTLRVSPTALLLKQRLEVEEVRAARVEWLRPFPRQSEKERPTDPLETLRNLSIPEIPRVRVHELTLERIDIARGVLPEAQTSTLHAELNASGSETRLGLDLHSLKGASQDLRLNLRLNHAREQVALSLRFDEAPGGLLGALAGAPSTSSLSARVDAQGPLSDLSANATLFVQQVASSEWTMRLSGKQHKALDLDGRLRLLQEEPEALPPGLPELFGREITLRGKAVLAKQEVRIPDLRVSSDRIEADLHAALDLTDRNFDLSLSARRDLPLSLPGAVRLTAPVVFDANCTGDPSRPDCSLRVGLTGLEAPGTKLADLRLAAHLRPVAPLEETFQGVRGTLTLSGKAQNLPQPQLVHLPAGPFSASADAELLPDVLRLDNILARIEPLLLSGTVACALPARAVSADLRIATPERPLALRGEDGEGADLRLELHARVHGTPDAEWDAALSGTLTPETLPPSLPDLLHNAPWRLRTEAKGRADQAGFSITADGPAAIRVKGSISGDATISADMTAALPPPLLHALTEMDASRPMTVQASAGLSGGRIELTADATLADARLNDLRAENVQIHLAARGEQDAGQGSLRLRADLQNREMELSSPFSWTDRAVEVSDAVALWDGLRIAGRLRAARDDLDAAFTLDAQNLAPSLLPETLSAEDLQGRVELNGPWSGLKVNALLRGGEVRAFTLASERFEMDLKYALDSGVGSLSGEFAGLRLGEVSLDTLAFRADAHPGKVDVSLSGRGRDLLLTGFSLDAAYFPPRSGGTEHRLELLRLDAHSLEQQAVLLSPSTLRFDPEAETLRLDDLALRVGEGRITVTGQAGPHVLNAGATVREVNIAPLARLFSIPLSGTLSLELDLSGSPDDPSVRFSADAPALRLITAGEEGVPLALTGRGSTAGSTLLLTIEAGGLGPAPLHLEGSLPIGGDPATTPSPGMDLVLKGQISARIAQSLLRLDDLVMQGVLDVDVRARGRLDAPRFSGALDLRDGCLLVLRSGTELQSVSGRVRLEGTRAVIERFSAADTGGGALALQGEANLDPDAGFPFTLSADLRSLQVVGTDALFARFSGDLRLRGDNSKGDLTGALRLDSATAYLPNRLPEGLTEIEITHVNRPEANRTASAPSTPTWPVALDVKMVIPARFFIQGRGVDAEWRGDLLVAGVLPDIAITGSLNIVRGSFDLLDKRFTISRGTIAFIGAMPPVPRVDILGEASTKEITALASLTGTPDRLDVELSSTPPLPRDEILARLLFNRSLSTVTPLQALRLAAAAAEVSGFGAEKGIMERAEEFFGVEQIEVGAGESGDPTLGVGKYIDERIYVRGEVGTEPDQDSITLGIEVTPNVEAESEVGLDAQGGVGLNWKKDY